MMEWMPVSENNGTGITLVSGCGLNEPCNHQWISVKDRLPENDQLVLVCEDNMTKMSVYHSGIYEHENETWEIYEKHCCGQLPLYYTNADVTHWMPLPEPPK